MSREARSRARRRSDWLALAALAWALAFGACYARMIARERFERIQGMFGLRATVAAGNR